MPLPVWPGAHQVCDSRAARDVHAGHRRPVPLGVPAGAGGDRRRRDDAGPAGRLLAPVDPAKVEVVRAVEYTFRAQVADRWRAGRVLLAGDAAHLSPPFVGQGLGLGLRDVHQLAWKLAAVLAGGAGEELLDTYQAEREPHARALIRVAQLLGRLMTGAAAAATSSAGACWPSSAGSRPWRGWRPTAGRRRCRRVRWSSGGAGPGGGWPARSCPSPRCSSTDGAAGWTTSSGPGAAELLRAGAGLAVRRDDGTTVPVEDPSGLLPAGWGAAAVSIRPDRIVRSARVSPIGWRSGRGRLRVPGQESA